jgi:hypothetical protein
MMCQKLRIFEKTFEQKLVSLKFVFSVAKIFFHDFTEIEASFPSIIYLKIINNKVNFWLLEVWQPYMKSSSKCISDLIIFYIGTQKN